jgi:hypothetical protein
MPTSARPRKPKKNRLAHLAKELREGLEELEQGLAQFYDLVSEKEREFYDHLQRHDALECARCVEFLKYMRSQVFSQTAEFRKNELCAKIVDEKTGPLVKRIDQAMETMNAHLIWPEEQEGESCQE